MLHVEGSHEFVTWHCSHCGATWTEDYVVEVARPDEDNEMVLLRRRGLPCMAPDDGCQCAECGSYAVTRHVASVEKEPAPAPPKKHQPARQHKQVPVVHLPW